MRKKRTVWLELLRRHRTQILRHLHEQKRRQAALTKIANKLSDYLRSRIETTGDAAAFWRAVPSVLACCNDQDTYEIDMAPEAYAWIHLLDRYVRTWVALENMVAKACLPLGISGVNVLDVGTGPGPSVFAIADFYQELSAYAVTVGEAKLVQPSNITAVELSSANNSFRSRFREVTTYPVGESNVIDDFRRIDPQQERSTNHNQLLDETEFDPETGYEVGILLPETANWEAQRLHRYRLVTFSNFLTTNETMQSVQETLVKILSDLQPGAVVLVLGGIGGRYPAIYSELDKITVESGLCIRIADTTVRSTPEDTEIIVTAAREIAAHIEELCPMSDDVPEEVRIALRRGDKWGSQSAIRVYRRNPFRVHHAT